MDAAAVDARLAAIRPCFALSILLLCGFGWVSDGAENIVLSFMLPTLEDTWNLSHSQLGFLATAAAFGQAMGAVCWGALADSVGRRPIFLLSLLLTTVFGVTSSTSASFEIFCVLRLLTGFAVGGNLPLAVSTATELLPPALRERGVVALQLFNEVGSLASTGLAALLLPVYWRTYLMIVATPAALVFAVALFRLPESPHWLVSRGRQEEAAALLVEFEAGRSGVLSVCSLARSHNALAAADAQSEVMPTTAEGDPSGAPDGRRRRGISITSVLASGLRSVRGLFARDLWRTTLLLSTLWFASNFASGWWTWLPEFAKLQGLPSASMYTSATVARVVAMAAFLLAAAIIPRLGAHRLLLLALVGTCALSFGLTLIVDHPRLLASNLFLGTYSTFALFFGVTWPVLYVITPSAFPSNARAAGFGFVSACSKLGGLTQPNVVAMLLPPNVSPPPAPPSTHPPPAAPALPPLEAPHSSLYVIGLIFTASWGVALAAAALQAVHVRLQGDERLTQDDEEGGDKEPATESAEAVAPPPQPAV